MKVAIPSNDTNTIFKHFGRTAGFVTCEIKNSTVVSKEYLKNTFTPHAPAVRMQNMQENGQVHMHGHSHNYERIFDALGNFDVIIAGRMGRHLYDEFTARGYKVYMTQESHVHMAIQKLIDGDLDNDPKTRCHH